MPFTDLIDLPAAPLQRGNLGPSANSETRSRARNRYSAAMEIRSGGISVAFFRVAAQRRSTRRRASARHFDHGWKCTPAGNVYGARENKTNKVTGAFVFYRYFVGRACGRSMAIELSIRVARRGTGAVRSLLNKAALSAR